MSTLTFCLETLPQYYSHDVDTSSSWFVIEAICVTMFTAEVRSVHWFPYDPVRVLNAVP